MLAIKLDKLSKKPIFLQVKEQIQKAILEDELQDLYLLPTEKEFSIFYNISMGSVKHAYDELESEGFIKRIKGKGSFTLNRPNLTISIGKLKDGALIPSFDPPLIEKILLIQKSKLDESPYPFIQLDLSFDYYVFKTLYLMQQKPVFIDEVYVSSKHYPNIDRFFPFKQSFSTISHFFDLTLIKQNSRFLTSVGDDFRLRLLQLQPKESITQFISVFYTEANEVGMIQIRYFPSAFTTFERVTKNV